ncbi:hypothetical protein E2C01_050908 [Portunus trituberculatus]|uniref:Uncharacterized protein n=1 Tax=Portunus trituberculatus TaxID=210409 RepID=A0A5B7G9J4_PORTR|nr:hypothetical protein [Portunus trituberculatus]
MDDSDKESSKTKFNNVELFSECVETTEKMLAGRRYNNRRRQRPLISQIRAHTNMTRLAWAQMHVKELSITMKSRNSAIESKHGKVIILA